MIEDFRVFYHRVLKQNFEKAEILRRNINKKEEKIVYAVGVGFFLVWLLLLFVHEVFYILLPFLTLLVAFLGVHIYKMKKRAIRNSEYRDFYKLNCIEPVVNFLHPNATYKPNAYIAKKHFESSLLFQDKIVSFSGEDFVHGSIGETKFGFSKLIVHNSKSSEKSPYFKGLFFIADFNKIIKHPLIVCQSTLEKERGDHGDTNLITNFENKLFERTFDVYCKDPITARYVISLDFMERLLYLNKKLSRNLIMSVVGERLYVAIPIWQNFFDPPIMVTQQSYSLAFDILAKLNHCFIIVDSLDLNTRIWTKE